MKKLLLISLPLLNIELLKLLPCYKPCYLTRVVFYSIGIALVIITSACHQSRQDNRVSPQLSERIENQEIYKNNQADGITEPIADFLDPHTAEDAKTKNSHVTGLDPERTMLRFFKFLDTKKLDEAWALTNNPYWNSSGKSWFVSEQGFGSTKKAEVLAYMVKSNGPTFAWYVVRCSIENEQGEQVYSKNVGLEKQNDIWLITYFIDAPK